MIVVDVNVVVHLLTEGPRRAQALRLWESDSDWRLPPLWRHELLNVLATLVREDYLEEADAIVLWERAVGLFADREVSPDMLAALRTAVRLGIGAYDAQYAVLAQSLRAPLVTEDRRLRSAVPDRALALAEAAEG